MLLLITMVTPARHSVTDNALTTVSGSLSKVTDNTVTNNISTTLLKVIKHLLLKSPSLMKRTDTQFPIPSNEKKVDKMCFAFCSFKHKKYLYKFTHAVITINCPNYFNLF